MILLDFSKVCYISYMEDLLMLKIIMFFCLFICNNGNFNIRFNIVGCSYDLFFINDGIFVECSNFIV